jgi:short-subunit dehydrogenase
VKALITGASGGIGKDMAIELSKKGYDLVLVARNENKLIELKKQLNTNCKIITMDLSDINNCFKLYNEVKNESIDVLINNAGFGLFGKFEEIDIEKEINMIDLNIRSLTALFKLFLKDFQRNNNGLILNVASVASFVPGPLMSGYYASKAYVLRLTLAVYEELRREKSNVHVSVLCPGPVETGFSERAGVDFVMKGYDSKFIARYAINKLVKHKMIIIPGLKMKFIHHISKWMPIPYKLLLRVNYHVQTCKK